MKLVDSIWEYCVKSDHGLTEYVVLLPSMGYWMNLVIYSRMRKTYKPQGGWLIDLENGEALLCHEFRDTWQKGVYQIKGGSLNWKDENRAFDLVQLNMESISDELRKVIDDYVGRLKAAGRPDAPATC